MSGPYRLGIRMDGTVARFIGLIIQQARAAIETRGVFRFFELGTAEGYTYSGVYQALTDSGLAARSEMVSCDLPNGWSTDAGKLKANMGKVGPWREHHGADSSDVWPVAGIPKVYYEDGRTLIGRLYTEFGFSPDFTFIDGCHGKQCLMKDFLAVEPTVQNGGLVVMHDSGEEEQHSDWQSHCGEAINVRRGIVDLGLMYNTRKGWEYIEQIDGDRKRGGEGNSHIVVRKVSSNQ